MNSSIAGLRVSDTHTHTHTHTHSRGQREASGISAQLLLPENLEHKIDSLHIERLMPLLFYIHDEFNHFVLYYSCVMWDVCYRMPHRCLCVCL